MPGAYAYLIAFCSMQRASRAFGLPEKMKLPIGHSKPARKHLCSTAAQPVSAGYPAPPHEIPTSEVSSPIGLFRAAGPKAARAERATISHFDQVAFSATAPNLQDGKL